MRVTVAMAAALCFTGSMAIATPAAAVGASRPTSANDLRGGSALAVRAQPMVWAYCRQERANPTTSSSGGWYAVHPMTG